MLPTLKHPRNPSLHPKSTVNPSLLALSTAVYIHKYLGQWGGNQVTSEFWILEHAECEECECGMYRNFTAKIPTAVSIASKRGVKLVAAPKSCFEPNSHGITSLHSTNIDKLTNKTEISNCNFNQIRMQRLGKARTYPELPCSAGWGKIGDSCSVVSTSPFRGLSTLRHGSTTRKCGSAAPSTHPLSSILYVWQALHLTLPDSACASCTLNTAIYKQLCVQPVSSKYCSQRWCKGLSTKLAELRSKPNLGENPWE